MDSELMFITIYDKQTGKRVGLFVMNPDREEVEKKREELSKHHIVKVWKGIEITADKR